MNRTDLKEAAVEGKVTAAQVAAMWDLQSESGYSMDDFLSRCQLPTPLTPYVGVRDFRGMFVGIEEDGYTHS